MCNWLAARIDGLAPIVPFNPADLHALTERAHLVDKKAPRLATIAAELGWHADADLDIAWRLIQRYDAEFYPGDPVQGDAKLRENSGDEDATENHNEQEQR